MSPQSAGAGTVFLHIGEPKTGTTYLQDVLWANRARFAEHGLLLPGKRRVDHWAAAEDLRQVEQEANDPFGPLQGAWDRLAAEARAVTGTAIISHELLAAADADRAAYAVASLQRAHVHVVLTVRDIATLLPAEWQESIKHRNTRAWRDWLGDVIDREAPARDRRQSWFWRVHDTLEILQLWAKSVPADRIHVITMPSSRTVPHLLWQRFARVIGIDPSAADLSSIRRNASLSMSEVEFVRRLNARVSDVPDWLYMRMIKDGLAHDTFANRDHAGDRLYLPADRDGWARAQAETLRAGLRAAPYDVVGDLDELLPPALPNDRLDPGAVAADDVLAAGLDAAVGLVAQLAFSHGVTLGESAVAAPAKPPGRLKAKLIELSRRSPALHRLRRRYWDVANAVRRIRGDRWRAVEDRNSD